MARIRTIKPEFWTDEKLADCSPTARLLFVGLWNFVDDYGNMERSARQIKAQVFPYDTFDCEPLLTELLQVGVISDYSVGDHNYIHVNNFQKHQLIDKKSKPRYPLPEDSTSSKRALGTGREGKGKGREPLSSEDLGSQNVPLGTSDIEEQVYAVAKVNPKLAHLPAGRIPRGEAEAIAEAIVRDGFDLVLTGTKNLADGVARWPKTELRYVPAPLKFYSRDEYKLPPETWERGDRPRDPELPAVSCVKCMDQGVVGRGVACDCAKGIEAAAAIEWNRKQKASATA